MGGLRAGYVRAGEETLDLHGVVYVPGVRVRGRIVFSNRPHGVLHVSGRAAARGRLVFRRDGSVTGRLGGRRVRVSAAGRSTAGVARLARIAGSGSRHGRAPPPGSFRPPVAGFQE